MTDEQHALILAAKALPQLLEEQRVLADARTAAEAAAGLAETEARAATEAGDGLLAKSKRAEALDLRRRAEELAGQVDALSSGPLSRAQTARAWLTSDEFRRRSVMARQAAREAVNFARVGDAPAELVQRLEARLVSAEKGVEFADELLARQKAERERVSEEAAMSALGSLP